MSCMIVLWLYEYNWGLWYGETQRELHDMAFWEDQTKRKTARYDIKDKINFPICTCDHLCHFKS